MNARRLDGLVAATYTPLDDEGAVDSVMVGPLVEHLLGSRVNGFYVCGSTGEGMSLTSSERKIVAEAYVQAAQRRVPVIVQVGHNSLAEARRLAAHAQEIGADMISATCPSYFKVDTVAGLTQCMAKVAG